MAKTARPSLKKRQKELSRQQRQQEKRLRRHGPKDPSDPRPEGEFVGEDPDIAGMSPGPQPLPEEWLNLPPMRKPQEPPEKS
jgi:hypothetical protein